MFIPYCKGFQPFMRTWDKFVSFPKSARNFDDGDHFFLECDAIHLYLFFLSAVVELEQQHEQFMRVHDRCGVL